MTRSIRKASTTTHTTTAAAALLRTIADQIESGAFSGGPIVEVPAKARTQAPALVAVPTGGFPKGSCQGCGKAGMISNPLCKKCRTGKAPAQEAAVEAPKVQKAPGGGYMVVIGGQNVAAKVAPEASAKGRRDPKAHCRATGCGLFVKAGEKKCSKHQKGASAPEGLFITLDDGSDYGFRIPADLVLSLRKAGLDDAMILAAAQAKGVGVAGSAN